MSTESITGSGDELMVSTEVPSLTGILSLPGFLYSRLQAAHLCAISEAELAARGIWREDIRDRLLATLED